MDRDTDLIPSSPTISSVSSSDLDSESTGSFFRDRSTTLGTLMGVSFPPEVSVRPVRVPSRRERGGGGGGGGGKPVEKRRGRGRGGRSWWRLCRDEVGPTSLGEFLQVERRMGGGDVAEGHFFYGAGGGGGAGADTAEHEAVGGEPLFQDGRVRPPPQPERRRQRAGEAVGRLPVLLTGICSGGEG